MTPRGKFPAGVCRFCRCDESNLAKLPDGEPAGWMDATRTVCTAIPCQIAYAAEQRRLIAQSSRATRKRTPGQIHQLKKDEKNARRRAARARKRSAA